MTNAENLARIAYTAYCGAVDNKAFNGDDLPTFDAIPERIKTAWMEAALAVAEAVEAAR